MNARRGEAVSSLTVNRQVGWLLPGAGLLLVCLWASLWWPITVDDSYIFYRYAANLAAGEGAVFNPGERVEGFSSPAWTALLALATVLGFSPVDASKGLGMAAALLTVVVVYVALKRSEATALAAGIGALWLASVPGLHRYTTSGMETVAFTAAVTAGAVLPALGLDRAMRGALMAAALVAVATLRPEGMLVAALLTAAWMWAYRVDRPARDLAAAWAVVGLVVVARFWYYGTLLPNTFSAKPSPIVSALRAGNVPVNLIDAHIRFNLVPALEAAGGTAVLLLASLAVWTRRREPAVIGAAVAALAGMIFVVYARLDWMHDHRFLLPFVPSLVFLAMLGATDIVQRLPDTQRRMVAVLWMACAVTWCGVSWSRTWDSLNQARTARGNTAMNAERYVAMGVWLRQHGRPSDRVLAYEIGGVGYASGMYVIDSHGLVSPEIARIVRDASGDYNDIRHGVDRAAMHAIVQAVVAHEPHWFLVRAVAPATFAAGDPVRAGIATEPVLNAMLERLSPAMEYATEFPLRPYGVPGDGDRYIILRRRSDSSLTSPPAAEPDPDGRPR